MTMIYNGRMSTVDFYRILVEAMDQVFYRRMGKGDNKIVVALS